MLTGPPPKFHGTRDILPRMSARGTGFAERLGVQLPLIDAGDCPHARAESLADILVNIGFNGATSPPSRFRLPSRNGHAIEQPLPSRLWN